MNKNNIFIMALIAVFVVFAGFSLYQPESPLMLLLRGKITKKDVHVITGPYPVEKDFTLLKKNGVDTIVSLLNPALPYENSLLIKEKQLCGKYGITLVNFPMNPISAMTGRIGGEENQKHAEEAVRAVQRAQGKVYLHCYLGIHRVQIVSKLLEQKGITKDKYIVREGDRSNRARRLDQAQADFTAGDFKKVIEVLGKIKNPEYPEASLLAWSEYRSNDIASAKKYFELALQISPENTDAQNGLGYCELRDGNPAVAETLFATSLKYSPNDTMALTGIGIAYYRQEKMKRAKEALGQALKIDPGLAEAKEIYSRLAGIK